MLALLNSYKNQEKLNVFVTTEEFNNLVLEEVVFQTGEHIFGTNMVRCNGVYCLKRFMRDYKVNSSRDIREWATRMTQLNEFIPYMLSEALDKKTVLKELFNKMDHWELLNVALPHTHRNRLLNMEWNTYKESYDETVDKLELIEPAIKAEALKDKKNART